MLIEFGSPLPVSRARRFLPWAIALGSAVALVAGLRLAWGWWQLRELDELLSAPSPYRQSLPPAPLWSLPPETGRDRVLDQISKLCGDSGIELVSLSVSDGRPPLLAWQASLTLRGQYPALKELAVQLAQRHRALTWTRLQWRALEGAAASGEASALVEAQFDLAWLRLPRAAPVAPPKSAP